LSSKSFTPLFGHYFFSSNYSSKIVAFLKARYPAPKSENPDEGQAAFPEGSNLELINRWFANMNSYEDKHMNYEKDFCKPQTSFHSFIVFVSTYQHIRKK
jgi:hypothetical protein